MRWQTASFALALVCVATAGGAGEQPSEKQATTNDAAGVQAETTTGETNVRRPVADGSPRQSMQGRFDASSPAVGQPLPDVAAYDADGNPMNLGNLKGHYSVIVFGCLT